MAAYNLCLPESRPPRDLHVPAVNEQNSSCLEIDRLPIGRMLARQHWSSLQSTPDLQHVDSDSRTYEKHQSGDDDKTCKTPTKHPYVVDSVVAVALVVETALISSTSS